MCSIISVILVRFFYSKLYPANLSRGQLFALPNNDVFLGFTFILTKRRVSRSLYELWTKLNSSH